MTMTTISVRLDADTARIYTSAPPEDQKKLRLLLSLWLREYAIAPTPLKQVMDQIGEKAQARGLTPEILESLLHAD